MTVTSARPGRMRAGSGTGQSQARPVISAAAQQPPTTGPVNEQPAGGAPGGIHAGELGHDDVRVAELRHRGFGGEVGLQALAGGTTGRVSASPSASSSTIGAGSCADSTAR